MKSPAILSPSGMKFILTSIFLTSIALLIGQPDSTKRQHVAQAYYEAAVLAVQLSDFGERCAAYVRRVVRNPHSWAPVYRTFKNKQLVANIFAVASQVHTEYPDPLAPLRQLVQFVDSRRKIWVLRIKDPSELSEKLITIADRQNKNGNILGVFIGDLNYDDLWFSNLGLWSSDYCRQTAEPKNIFHDVKVGILWTRKDASSENHTESEPVDADDLIISTRDIILSLLPRNSEIGFASDEVEENILRELMFDSIKVYPWYPYKWNASSSTNNFPALKRQALITPEIKDFKINEVTYTLKQQLIKADMDIEIIGAKLPGISISLATYGLLGLVLAFHFGASRRATD